MALKRTCFFAAVCASLIFASCSKKPDVVRETLILPPAESLLVRAVESLCRAVEDDNSFAFFDLVSEYYTPSNLSLKSAVDQELERNVGITIHLTIVSTEIMESENRGVVVASWRMSKTSRDDGTILMRDGTTEFRFTRSGNNWLLSQQNGDMLFGH